MAEVVRVSVVHVVVVDDAENWRRSVASMLRAEPFEIIGEATNGLEAVQLVERMQPTVVLLDIGIPGLDGIEAGERIRKLAPDAKILFVSQESDPDIVRAALQLGAWGYVLKSEAARDLVEAIHTVVLGKKFVSSSVAGHHFTDSP
jgi:two-component system, NarL family, response regulator NreC